MPRWIRALLQVPLAAKLAGANILVFIVAAPVVLFLHHSLFVSERQMMGILVATFAASLAVNLLLVRLALRPLRALEQTARQVSGGNYSARVPGSLIADADMARIGGTINVLLDNLTADREHARQLASQIISAGDRERAHIARELHDSMAQSLAGLTFYLSAAARDASDPVLATRLESARQIAVGLTDEVRALSHTVHPRVLDDLGLPAALRNLARELEVRGDVAIEVHADLGEAVLSPAVASVLYRVAQEAVANAIRHAHASVVTINLAAAGGRASLEVSDDGAGFDVTEAERRRPGMGLFTMRERVALVDGGFEIASRRGSGTVVRATVPLR